MRRRLLASTVAVLMAALLLLGVPLAAAVAMLLTRQSFDELQRLAEQAQVLVEGEPTLVRDAQRLLAHLSAETGTRLMLVDARAGQFVLIDTGGPPGSDLLAGVDADLRAAAAGQVGRVRAPGVVAVTVPVRGGQGQRLLRAMRPDEALRGDIRRAWAGIGGVALAALVAAVALAGWQAARLARPLESLAGSAARLGEGDFTARAPRSGIEDLDRVAAALDATAARLAEVLARGRSFREDASHQLRTPLTALRLDLEAMHAGGVEPQLLGAAVAEVDRLEATIAELEQLAEPAAADEVVDLAHLAAERLDVWRSLASAQGRPVELRAAPGIEVRARSAALSQGLQALLDNALEHGRGRITVMVERAPGGARLCVADQGPGMPEQISPGRGLPLAESLVAAEGGRLRVERLDGGVRVCLVLPAPTLPG